MERRGVNIALESLEAEATLRLRDGAVKTADMRSGWLWRKSTKTWSLGGEKSDATKDALRHIRVRMVPFVRFPQLNHQHRRPLRLRDRKSLCKWIDQNALTSFG